ncbi:MAG: family 16 glycosylhydrolase [Clostridia bacterium]|nr:family 16 glycosylhydrolase [Clostridia bacterium]
MAKSVKSFFIIAISALFMTLAGCGASEPPSAEPPEDSDPPSTEQTFTPHASAAGIPDRLTLESEKIVKFSEGGSSDFYWANGYSNGGMFNCVWQKNNAEIANGVMSMSVSKEGSGYAGAEYRTNKTYSYGYFSACMKAANCSGLVSSLFTYTNKPVWDEIDIEFLGKDTTKVQFNYFTNGVGEHEFLFDLGFDASKEFHEYGFDWQPDSIVWYVDGIAVYKVTQSLPSHPMQIMANVWNGIGVDDWLGTTDDSSLPATAQYKWFAYVPH